ncbi:hypothetical protein OJJOAM_003925 [Cupriavidus sp. H18C1]
MDRRQFLKWGSFITVSVATTGLAGCGGGDDNPDPPEPDLFDFRHGVASGDPRPDSVVLWTRVEGDNGRRHVNVRLQVSTQEDFSTLVVNDHLRALPEWDYTLRTKVTGLNAATTYYYRFRVGSRFSPVGRTRTAPAAGTPLSQLKFAFVSCQDWSINHWAGMEELAQQDLDFIVHTGDYIYEAVADGAPVSLVESRHTPLSLPDGTTLPSGFRYATTLEDYRYLYKAYRSDARLQALHARFPMIAIWDDHEFSDDCWQDRQSYDADDDQSPQTARRRSANQAWFEYLPADVTLDLNNPSFQNIQIYRSFTFGNLATLLMTDERLYRADHLISEANAGGDVGSRFFIRRDALKAAEDAKIAAAGGALTQVSMLGDAQRAWWQDRVGGAATTWKLWGNQVSLLRMQIDLTEAIAELMVLRLIASNTALTPLRDQMETALTADLRAALSSGTYPNNVAYANLRQLLSTQAGIDSATFDANIKPTLDSRLPPASLLATYVLNADQWDGYDAERRNLMAFLKTNNVRNVVALTGGYPRLLCRRGDGRLRCGHADAGDGRSGRGRAVEQYADEHVQERGRQRPTLCRDQGADLRGGQRRGGQYAQSHAAAFQSVDAVRGDQCHRLCDRHVDAGQAELRLPYHEGTGRRQCAAAAGDGERHHGRGAGGLGGGERGLRVGGAAGRRPRPLRRAWVWYDQ